MWTLRGEDSLGAQVASLVLGWVVTQRLTSGAMKETKDDLELRKLKRRKGRTGGIKNADTTLYMGRSVWFRE
ncbi:hypothetical protein Landi51_12689 [Colletotrichum acutatum]